MRRDQIDNHPLNKRQKSNSAIHKPEQETSSKYRKFRVTPHPNGVKPLGNCYFDNKGNCRDIGLGTLSMILDEVLLFIFEYLDMPDLVRVSEVSKALYVYAQTESLWKSECLDAFEGDFRFQGSWKSTFIYETNRRKGKETLPSAPLRIDNFYSDVIYNQWYCSNVDLSIWASFDNIDRRSNLSVEEFFEEYAKPNKPVIITDIVSKWPAKTEWTREKLIANYGDIVFKTDQGINMKLKDYFQYCGGINETSPMYLFDNLFAQKAPQLALEYEVPPYFKEDYFSVLSEPDRPSFRWILVGPQRSGSSFHKDPNATSAWNGLISGCKKWLLYPPDEVPPGVHPSEDGWEVETPEGVVEWFIDFYPETKKSGAFQPVECVMKPGELLFIPSGWWHTALNLEESIAVTQNVVNHCNMVAVNSFLKSKPSQELYNLFNAGLKQHFPSVAEELDRQMIENPVNYITKNKTEDHPMPDAPPKKSFWQNLTQTGESEASFSLF